MIIINRVPIVKIEFLNVRISNIGCFKDNWRLPYKNIAINPMARIETVVNTFEVLAALTAYIIPANPILDSTIDK